MVIEYQSLSKFLPDSLKQDIIKVKRTRDELDAVNILCLSGWEIVSVSHVVSSSNNIVSSSPVYVLKKEIEVSEAEYQLIQERMKKYLK
jgi:hypothetical protein